MAKKKNRKKHQFKYGQQAVLSPMGGLEPQASKGEIKIQPDDVSYPSYIRRDLIRVGLLASCFIAGEVLLWVVFNYTEVGGRVYTLFGS
jgi:hypothetical protein